MGVLTRSSFKKPETVELVYAELNEERMFLEGLLQQRFNFFIVAFGLAVAAGATANDFPELIFVLVVGFVLCLLLAIPVYRIFVKADASLIMMHTFKDKPMDKVAVLAEKKWRLSFQANDYLGYWIPGACLLAFIVWGLLASCGAIPVK